MSDQLDRRTPRMGGQPILRVFLLANDDVASAVIHAEENGERPRPGLRELVRERYAGAFDVEITHEACPSSKELALQLGAGAGVLGSSPDVIVLSVTSDLGTAVEDYLADMNQVIPLLKEKTDARVIMFNCSSVDPDDATSNYHGTSPRSLAVHRLNRAALSLSAAHGISIVDVDRLMAELGAELHVRRLGAYSPAAAEAICRELLRVITEYGFFEHRSLALQIGRKGAKL